MKHYLFIVLFIFVQSIFSQNTIIDTTKVSDLDEIVIVEKKKAIENKVDRTIFNFSDQPHLTASSLMDGLKKLPALVISEVAGMMYQGKLLEVFQDGRPLNLYSNELNSYLESMPGNAVEKVEIITQPGAEFPATSGGAIINIITSKKAKNYLSASYSGSYSMSSYDKVRNRYSNSVMLNAKNKWFSWQVQLGQNHRESFQQTTLKAPTFTYTDNFFDNTDKSYFVNTGVKISVNELDNLLINYDLNKGNNKSIIISEGLGFSSQDKSQGNRFWQDLMLTYQKRFKDYTKKLDFRFQFNNSDRDFSQNNLLTNVQLLDNTTNQNFFQFKTDYSQQFSFLEETKWSSGILGDYLNLQTSNFLIDNLNYHRQTQAIYTEFNSKYKNFNFILGGRLEHYNIFGSTDEGSLNQFEQYNFFPNATLQYNFSKEIFVNTNYNRKINLPNTSALNPNNTNFQNPAFNSFGNPNLEPAIFDNYEIKISAFDYAYLSYNMSQVSNLPQSRFLNTETSVLRIFENIPSLNIHNFNFGLPVPFMLFTEGLNKLLEFDFNPDKINFVNVNINYQHHQIPSIDTKGIWYFNLYMQIILPEDLNFTTSYSYSTTGGNYYYFIANTPFNHTLDFNLSKKFLNDNLSVNLFAHDVFNTLNYDIQGIGSNVNYLSRRDSRRFGISLNYKLPTKGKEEKLIKEKESTESNNKI